MHSTINNFCKRFVAARRKPLNIKTGTAFLMGLSIIVLAGCNKDTGEKAAPKANFETQVYADDVWQVGARILAAASTEAKYLDTAMQALIHSPTNQNLLTAQSRWQALSNAYEPFAFFAYLGQHPNAILAPVLEAHNKIGPWPIQPGYLDTYQRYRYSGLVFNLSLPLTEASIREAHQMTAHNDIALGIYAIEYLLFGEQRLRGPLVFKPIEQLTQQHKDNGFEKLEELPQNRRRQLISLLSTLLVKDLTALQSKWQDSSAKSLRKQFSSLSTEEQAHMILFGVGALLKSQAHIAKELGLPQQAKAEGNAPSAIDKKAKAQRMLFALDAVEAAKKYLHIAPALDSSLVAIIQNARTAIESSSITGATTEAGTVNIATHHLWKHIAQTLFTLNGELNVLASQFSESPLPLLPLTTSAAADIPTTASQQKTP